MSHVAVLDLGKTNIKLALVDRAGLREVAVRKAPNDVRPGPPYPHFDTDAQWDFFASALRELGAEHEIDAISITAHGATGALLRADGSLALPVLDYEHEIPAEAVAAYDALRPDFAETGSPRLPCGLNLGAQLHWQMTGFAQARDAALFLTWPQYWAHRLTGVAAVEPTSLGCHTDLWNPWTGELSSLVDRMGWRGLFPPLRRADEVLGGLTPRAARETGLPEGLPVHCGIHDSNASLYPHLTGREDAFSVVSTGTWVVCMSVGGAARALDPSRDTLANTDAHGRPVPSARFMGGREFERVREGRPVEWSEADLNRMHSGGPMLLPAVEPGSGPFQGRAARWTTEPASDGERMLALSWYLAMMTATCLDLTGGAGPVIVEGPFAGNTAYLEMLAAATGRPVEIASGATGTAVGAALLACPGAVAGTTGPGPSETNDLRDYAARWRCAVKGAEGGVRSSRA
ncbi:sugar (pentulose or hexulose) kinase [Limimaricola variabilis]|uniref:Sugar (Pentulose or hexulose) kinase n=1 Tax=Limimaricola variabilis TaxID=1492771 RepID=A0ABR6HSU3_9RHOB|nr:FGGY-family carbohydrate kinase [Limimaricola variabilis]MBB3713543.1 sugar (pentulose or hexulose) kinase [Limimaricola variabilis]